MVLMIRVDDGFKGYKCTGISVCIPDTDAGPMDLGAKR
jgi:hypothetical protein